MIKLSLQKIIGPRKDAHEAVQLMIGLLSSSVCITDAEGQLLAGEEGAKNLPAYAIVYEGETYGYVHGSKESADALVSLLQLLLLKEAGQKKLGAEVLSMYHEINVIYNFTDELAQTIDTEGIARAALQKAMESIAADEGVLVLWDEGERKLQIPASTGDNLIQHNAVQSQPLLLLQIGQSGNSEIITDLAALKESGIVNEEVQSLMYAAMKVKHRIMGAIMLAGKKKEQFSAGQLKLLVTLALQSSSAIETAFLYEKNIAEVRSREEAILRIHEVTKRFVPNEFISALGRDKLTEVKLGDQAEKIVTVLFTDIRDYTTISEKLTPEETFKLVNAFNALLGPIIREYNGFVNQYQGDSIMAIFPEKAEDALQAAIAMQHALYSFSKKHEADGIPAIRAGIGMHTGPLIMGITGDHMRMSNTTIADTVNTAARIESLTRHYHCSILLSEDTYSATSQHERYHVRNLGSVRLKGKHKQLNLLECIDGFEKEVLEVRKANLPAFSKALKQYHARNFEEAIDGFRAVLSSDAGDMTTAYFLQHAERFEREGTPQGWDGIQVMVAK